MTMDIGFLGEYEAQEKERIASSSLLDQCDQLKKPISFIQPIPDHSIWGQVPFSGTSIINLRPISEEMFSDIYNLKKTDLPDLIRFARESKKIKFVLGALPTKFYPFDYLEPILEEFHPPVLTPAPEIYRPAKEISNQLQEVLTPILRLSPELNSFKYWMSGEQISKDLIDRLALLKFFGFDGIADTIIDNVLINPYFALEYSSVATSIFLDPVTDPFKAISQMDLETLRKAVKFGFIDPNSVMDNRYQEIGSFLLNKTTNYPDSLSACQQVIGRYNSEDLYNVWDALNVAVRNQNISQIIEKGTQLEDILDQIWQDARSIRANADTYHLGISVTCGMIGHYVSGSTGLLAAFGIAALDYANSQYLQRFSELIAKGIASPYLSTIYDFQNKYPQTL